MSQYAKALASIVMAALVSLQTVVAGPITLQGGCTIAVAVLSAVGVYLVPNLPGSLSWAKTAVAALLAGAQAAVQVAGGGGLTTQGLVTIAIAALGVVSVYVVPNKAAPARPAA
jgi:hypothetical protein